MIKADNMDDVLLLLLKEIEKRGEVHSPRGLETKEILGASFELTNPRNRVIINKKRKMSISFAIGEFLWYLRGSNQLEIINYYNKRYKNYSDDGETLYGAYGKRIFGQTNTESQSQWSVLKEKLKNDPSSRQAVISIFTSKDLNHNSKDIPCTCLLQFFIRNNALHCITYMRSNDIIWGLPYDVFSFTMFQELLANQLGVNLGTYKHFAGSLHLYSNHYNLSHEIQNTNNPILKAMDTMPFTSDEDINKILEVEALLRNGKDYSQIKLPEFWEKLISIIQNKETNRPSTIIS
ncbi:thymidylate synthase [Robertmurraya kyonggiensis]|uniref:thymidylate synthase n=1 Tax=Robertmurraya kyonggiensis TaxID=1037680 RepID=A0A4U1D9D5_9BACI|nr:thymidylate synthase [Robertmurraya kyonggiensis]TKC19102.1 thymidylate synthase [Robertmurraya kyonggiensis]